MNKDINLTDGAVTEVLNNKVDIDFQNVPSNSVGFARCSTEVTNCITEIPQRIKLELKDGVLTLKAGSQVIIPNGFEEDGTTPKFDEMLIEANRTIDGSSSSNGQYLVCASFTYLSIVQNIIQNCTSGNGATAKSGFAYNTTTNMVNNYSEGGSIGSQYSLPVGIITITDGAITSIDQVFNGIGYIGSTIWVDKGVKGLAPNGRNEDGTLNNIETVTDKVSIINIGTVEDSLSVYWHHEGFITSAYSCVISQTPPTKKYKLFYKPVDNELWTTHTNANGRIYGFILAEVKNSKNGIISFKPKFPFRAVDYSDSSTVSGWGMPSNKYIDLTLGASGTEYTAPANGYFYFVKTASPNQVVGLMRNNIGSNSYEDLSLVLNGPSSGNAASAVFLPVKKGDKVKVSYNATGATLAFRFFYAEGEV